MSSVSWPTKTEYVGILAELNLSPDAQEKILSEGLVCYFMTINEPTVLLFNSYMGGMFPPYKRGSLLMRPSPSRYDSSRRMTWPSTRLSKG